MCRSGDGGRKQGLAARKLRSGRRLGRPESGPCAPREKSPRPSWAHPASRNREICFFQAKGPFGPRRATEGPFPQAGRTLAVGRGGPSTGPNAFLTRKRERGCERTPRGSPPRSARMKPLGGPGGGPSTDNHEKREKRAESRDSLKRARFPPKPCPRGGRQTAYPRGSLRVRRHEEEGSHENSLRFPRPRGGLLDS